MDECAMKITVRERALDKFFAEKLTFSYNGALKSRVVVILFPKILNKYCFVKKVRHSGDGVLWQWMKYHNRVKYTILSDGGKRGE